MQENYLAKWLNGELSEEELADFKKSDAYASYAKIRKASENLEAPDFDETQAWERLKGQRSTDTPKVVPLRPYRQFLRIAAVIAIMMIGSYFYMESLDDTYRTQLAERTQVLLPDASEVLLNADSKVSFSADNWENERRITLDGEAFFKVAKGKKFTVATTQGSVSVLGTQFNVENRDGFFEVTCYEGLVSVSFNGTEQRLPAGSSFVAVAGEIRHSDQVVAVNPSWMDDESSFKSIPLHYVFEELERQFDVKVKVENVDTDQLFTGTFSNSDLTLALESISTPSQIRYTLEGENVLFYAENRP
ncbi:FecR domain-containing protein [Flagellimonas sp. DF-77]|uniref:FecR family protein n=1 Tax=Flagellimonas algarum TaxID=3230298 RepID=UPI00339179C2